MRIQKKSMKTSGLIVERKSFGQMRKRNGVIHTWINLIGETGILIEKCNFLMIKQF